MNNMTTHKVYVTGLGGVAATGMDLNTIWDALLEGETGIRPVTCWDKLMDPEQPLLPNELLGGELKDYQPRRMIPDPKWLKIISRQDVIGLNAAFQAVEHSDCIPHRDALSEELQIAFNDNTGIYVGSAGNKFFQQYDFMPLFAQAKGTTTGFAEHLFETVHPMWLLKILPNNVLAYVGIQYGFKGANQNIPNHAASGLQAIIEAYWAIALGQIERAVVVAYDAATEPQSMAYYSHLGTLSQSGTLRPFDTHRDGTILGEGAAAFILESESAAKARGATCYAEILGGKSTAENCGIFGLDETAEPLIRGIESLLEHAQLTPNDIGMVTAHGNGNIQSDATEAKALQHIFQSAKIPVTAFKWSFGHTLCASGLLDTVLTVQSLRENTAPGIATLNTVAPDCQNLSLSSQHQKPLSSVGLVIGRGFGGIDSCVLLKAL